VNTRTIIRAKLFTSFLALVTASTAYAEWKVDFSRRMNETRNEDLRAPASADVPQVAPVPAAAAPQPSFFETIFQGNDVAQEIVVLNTEKGFVPSTIRVRKGLNYQIHVVNVNEKEKNVSFVLDSFSEHHATFYGKIKSFVVRPVKEGVYKFVSPETGAQGKLVVAPESPSNRLPASE
jgi:hypothetical protein